VPLMIVASVAMLLLGLDGNIGRFDGVGLFVGLICYTTWTVVKSRRESADVKMEFEQEFAPKTKPAMTQFGLQLVLIVVGLVMLTFGAGWLVDGSVTIARLAGMSE